MALIDPTTIYPGGAQDFLDDLNENFTTMQTNAATVNSAVDTLRSEIKPVGFSGNASDLTQDATHRLVTDTQKETWNKKVTIDTASGSTQYHIYQDGTDLTTNIQALFASGAWKPTKTSDLINDSNFIGGSLANASTAVYVEDVLTEWVADSSPVETGSDFTTKWQAVCADATHKCTEDMVPIVILSQEDSMGGDWAQVCESGDGVVYLWSKAGTSSHPVTAITVKAICCYQPVEITAV